MEIQDTTTEDTIVVGGVSEVDDELLIRLDHYQQERDDDITGRPNFEPIADCGSVFYPFKLEQRHPILSTLLASPVDLFQLFLPISLVESWVCYTNEAPEPARGPGPGSHGNSSYTQQPSQRGKAWSPTSVPEIYLWLAIQIYIARVNCGIYEPFVMAKQQDNKGKCWAFNTIKAAPTPEGQSLKVNQIAWKDNALVLMLTTVFTADEFVRRVRRRPRNTA
ncbi:hypothetical protein S40288_10062 [Stachybotrys chartarum IBT 40288]|nr:hypothetical protein S40288_10062 [Stachybotrys chartarum IBT 40288]